MRKYIRILLNFILKIFSCKIKSNGHNNDVTIKCMCKMKNTKIVIRGNNNHVYIDNYCNINGLRILVLGDNNRIRFGENVVINASDMQPTVINAVGGTSIEIGDGSLLSNNIEIHSSDYHGIYNSGGDRINYEKNIRIGRNVWIGLRTILLKGTEIDDGSIIGAGSVCSGRYCKNSIICGNPAKIKKRNIFWSGDNKDYCEVPDALIDEQ